MKESRSNMQEISRVKKYPFPDPEKCVKPLAKHTEKCVKPPTKHMKNVGFNGKFYTFPYFLAFLLKRFLAENTP